MCSKGTHNKMNKLATIVPVLFAIGVGPVAWGANWAADPTLTPAEQKERSAWYARQMRPDVAPQLASCCGEADAYYADDVEVVGGDVYAIITDEREVPNRPYIKPGTRILVPPERNNDTRNDPNYTGHTVIFVRWYSDYNGGYVYCYLPDGGV
jgi:hypothetical protein